MSHCFSKPTLPTLFYQPHIFSTDMDKILKHENMKLFKSDKSGKAPLASLSALLRVPWCEYLLWCTAWFPCFSKIIHWHLKMKKLYIGSIENKCINILDLRNVNCSHSTINLRVNHGNAS